MVADGYYANSFTLNGHRRVDYRQYIGGHFETLQTVAHPPERFAGGHDRVGDVVINRLTELFLHDKWHILARPQDQALRLFIAEQQSRMIGLSHDDCRFEHALEKLFQVDHTGNALADAR